MRRTSTPRVLGVLASLALALALLAAPAEAVKNGTLAQSGDVPSAAAVLIDAGGGGLCSGVLIGPRAVLTAAGCVSTGGVTTSTSRLTVVLGERDLADADADEIYQVVSVRVDPAYDATVAMNDAAVLVLSRPAAQSADGDVVAPASLVSTSDTALWDADSPATIAGWGVTGTGDGAGQLRVGDMTVLSDATCGTNADATLFCASGGAQACDGDTGAPLLVQDGLGHDVVAGIALFGPECSSTGEDYFARMGQAPLATWVRKALDTTGPRAVGASPTGRKVKRSASVTVTFSEAVKKSTIAGQAITLARLTAGGPVRVPGKLKVSADGLRATFNPFGGGKKVLAGGAHYRVVAGSGIQDLLGNPFDQKPSKQGNQLKKWEFTTKR